MQRGSLARLAALGLIWGSSFLFIAVGLRGFEPIQIVLGRLAAGAAVLLAVLALRGKGLPREPMLWVHMGVMGLLANLLPFLLFAVGEKQVSSGIAGVANATTPLWTILLGYLAGKDRRVTWLRVAGIVLGFAGVLIIFSPWESSSQAASWGGVACLAASAFYGVGFIWQEKYLVGRGYEPAVMMASQLSAATVLTLVALPFLGGLKAPEWRLDSVAALLALGAAGTGAALVMNYRLVVDEGPAVASLTTYLAPIVAVTLGALALGEDLSPQIVLGAAIVLGSVALIRRQPAVSRSLPVKSRA
ncbi:DMT family transporter [Longispora albida]|uniref:DMT family transporter n=1 Tax=Longispora albida TaxID=203523 RepID=UPI00047815F4|nr:EamA family transporter [Longispora albida]